MTVKLDFEECLKDSPRFRSEIEKVEVNVGELETRLEKLVKQCHTMLETGRAYCQNSKSFVNGLKELGHHCSEDRSMGDCLEKFSKKLSAIVSAQEELIETTQKDVKLKLQNFVKDDVKRFKDVRKEFERSSENLEAALSRNAQAPRGKQHEVEEASNNLLIARRAFRSGALDYVLQINVIESRKKTEILQAMLSLIQAQALFFQQSHQSLAELENYRKELHDENAQLVLNSARDKRDMEQRHGAVKKKDVSYDDSIMDFSPDAPNGIAMEGYLYKRASNAFKTWSRRWFSIQKNQLVYQKKHNEQITVVVEDLRLCTVKPCSEQDRRFCFEVVSPSKSCLLQADSERQQQSWISAVQNSIASAFQERRDDNHSSRDRCSSVSVGSVRLSGGEPEACVREALEEVQAISGNSQCCDCGEPGPDWASINLGITLCITCSGIHRSLGVHFSKVRSLTLDSWEPELVKLMCELGNTAINKIYEARIEEITIKKPHPSSPRQDKESWIRSKYVEKKFIHKLPETGRGQILRRSSARRNRSTTEDKPCTRPALKPKPGRVTLPRLTGLTPSDIMKNNSGSHKDNNEEEDLSGLHPGALLYRSASMQHFPLMADALAHGADVNWVNVAEDSKTPLIQAVIANSLAACEFLLQNGANVNQVDSNGRGPLHHATILGHTGLVCLFLKRGADYNAKDIEEKDPIGIAIDNANADIVTLLRIAKMNKEMREMDGTPSGDDTYHDIFRDFSQMASNNPEKLKRRSADMK
ncbi:arf-GAP with coiled-coil, ANK repeat and PH domain-containing protein 1 [Danio rerio]|uniref:Arf-GAP with coiled-coil, ANK repeat and PH domain-containing protein n=1 Tax=Danio rerio TaxID=7955 RepID=A1L1F5_DANRE|nr:arf-GAP with coiled-coil, ANK repeat and PH domain-containing protein 1 [Danio rerio]AAI29037.1 Zgc:153917 [Danio rerio]|eukprot:NP_001074048.1 arf-GAP with coiled-coil, ANK repeat and PH domain-containing protein 1 [Danio rerio]